jgi:hypothetical protein
MPLEHLMTDRVALVKRDGRRFEDIKAAVQPTQIVTFDTRADIEEGDSFERIVPSGRTESYHILEAGYQAAVGGIPASYVCQVRKDSSLR